MEFPTKTNRTPSKRALEYAWLTGKLEYKFRPIQWKFSDAWERAQRVSKKFVLRSTRRAGKSTWLLMSDFMDCIKTPNTYIAFVAPVKQGLEEYINQVANQILSDCPAELRPKWRTKESQFYFPRSNSTITCAGSNSKSYNNLRGKKFARVSVDEAAFVDDLDELVEGVCLPSIFDSNGLLRLSSSAPELPDHPFDEYYNQAVSGGYAAQFTIYDAGYPLEMINEWIKEYGGKDSARFKREFLCLSVIDPERRIIPEWRDEYERETSRPNLWNFTDRYMAMDIGTEDKTVNLFAYYDFENARIVVEDEVAMNGPDMTTQKLADAIKETKARIWGDGLVYRHVADNNNLILLQDLSAMHGLAFNATSKDSLAAMVNKVRLWVSTGRIHVNPRCSQLIGCLRNGIWDTKREEFSRSKAFGHFDALAALVYLVRNIDETRNPIPANYGKTYHTHMIQDNQNRNQMEREILKMVNLSGF